MNKAHGHMLSFGLHYDQPRGIDMSTSLFELDRLACELVDRDDDEDAR